LLRAYKKRLIDIAVPHGFVGRATVSSIDAFHLADSLELLRILDGCPRHERPLRIADVGTGAGLPGIPLAIARPSMNFHLIESRKRRCCFIQDTIEALNLANVEVVHMRGESAGRNQGLREHFDLVAARALSLSSAALEVTFPLCRVGGSVALFKTEKQIPEIKAAVVVAHRLGGALRSFQRYEFPGLVHPRVIATFSKLTTTSSDFPRRPGVPERRPLAE
jgi:16S rRNA (guanine527-N7)-methyltransferase